MPTTQYHRVGLSVKALRSEHSLRRQTMVSFLLYLASAVATVLWALLGTSHVTALRGRSRGAANYYARPALGGSGAPHDACFLIVQSAEPFNFMSHAHIDAVEAMASALEALGLVVTVDSYIGGSWTTPCGGARHTVLVGWPQLASYPPAAAERLPPATVLWNFERVEEGSAWFIAPEGSGAGDGDGEKGATNTQAVAMFRAALRSDVGGVWESAAANIAPLIDLLANDDSDGDHAIARDEVLHVPIGWVQGMTCDSSAGGRTRTGAGAALGVAGTGSGATTSVNAHTTTSIDVVMIGRPSTRRQTVIKQLNRMGLAVTVLQDVFGEDRDAVLKRTAVILNVHRHVPLGLGADHVGVASSSTSDQPSSDTLSASAIASSSGSALLSLREVERILPMLAKGGFILSEMNDRGGNSAGIAWSPFEDIARQALAWSHAGRAVERRAVAARGQLLVMEQTSLYEHPAVVSIVRRWRVARSVGSGALTHFTGPLTCEAEIAIARSTVESWDAAVAESEQEPEKEAVSQRAQPLAPQDVAPLAAAMLGALPEATPELLPASDVAAAASQDRATLVGSQPTSADQRPSEQPAAVGAPPRAVGGAPPSWDIAPEHALELPDPQDATPAPARDLESTTADLPAISSAGPVADVVSAMVHATSLLGGTSARAGNNALLALEEPPPLLRVVAPPGATPSVIALASTTASPLLPALPLGWERGIVAKSQRVYFFNRETGATSWDVPTTSTSV